MELRLAVEIDVLRGVDEMEAEDTAPDAGGEQPRQRRFERVGRRGPGAHRRGGERESEEGVRVGGEAFRERVAEDHGAGNGTKREAEKIETRAPDDDGDERHDAEREGGAARAELAAAHGARVEDVVVPVGPAVEGHRGSAGTD